jgi:hypothetical protein
MKILLLLLLAFGVSAARADIMLSRPTVLTVSNLSAFPKYHFQYALARDEKAGPQPLLDKTKYEFKDTIRLLVHDGDEQPQLWATIKYQAYGKKVSLTVDDVHREGPKIIVSYQLTDAALPAKRQAAFYWKSTSPFVLTGVSLCGLVLLARRRQS